MQQKNCSTSLEKRKDWWTKRGLIIFDIISNSFIMNQESLVERWGRV